MTSSRPGIACLLRSWQLHESELKAFLRHRLQGDAAADDLLQDVFMKAMRQGGAFCRVDNPRAWLFQVARNALIDHLRRPRVHEPLAEALHEAIAEQPPEPQAPVDALSGCLDRVLSELPADDAEILRACDIEGQTQREFAAAKGLSLPATKSRLLRARQRLRERMTVACQVRFDDAGIVEGHVPRGNTATD